MKPSDLYSSLIKDGRLTFDKEQSILLKKFDELGHALTKRSKSWFGNKKIKGLEGFDLIDKTLQTSLEKNAIIHDFLN